MRIKTIAIAAAVSAIGWGSCGIPAIAVEEQAEEAAPRQLAPETSGWRMLATGQVQHPGKLMDYPDTAGQIAGLVGDRMEEVELLLTGTGSGTTNGDTFVSETCESNNCSTNGMLVYADIPNRELYLAWRSEGAKEVTVVPAEEEWPAAARRRLTEWAHVED